MNPLELSPLICYDPAAMRLIKSGSKLPAIWDISGNANDAVQADPTKQPVFLSGALNGLPGILGDGVASIMQTPAIPEADTFWAFIVARQMSAQGTSEIASITAYPGASPCVLIEWTDLNGGLVYINSTATAFPAGSELPMPVGKTAALLLQWTLTVASLTNDLGQVQASTGVVQPKPVAPLNLFGRNDGAVFGNVTLGYFALGLGALTPDQASSLFASAKRWIP